MNRNVDTSLLLVLVEEICHLLNVLVMSGISLNKLGERESSGTAGEARTYRTKNNKYTDRVLVRNGECVSFLKRSEVEKTHFIDHFDSTFGIKNIIRAGIDGDHPSLYVEVPSKLLKCDLRIGAFYDLRCQS